tara:strand:- start:258 stop:416 length:159 start_codon:yes stop_codon:yes gene_type:complete
MVDINRVSAGGSLAINSRITENLALVSSAFIKKDWASENIEAGLLAGIKFTF